jgi:hypothetical protein
MEMKFAQLLGFIIFGCGLALFMMTMVGLSATHSPAGLAGGTAQIILIPTIFGGYLAVFNGDDS